MSAHLHRVFVYGTLKRGQPNHHILQQPRGVARLLGGARLARRYPLILTQFGIPMLLAKEGTGEMVEGELYEVDELTLEQLDQLEHHPTLYTRTPTHCHLLTPSPSTTHTTLQLECETYLVFDFADAALKLPHYSSYDVYDLPRGVATPPSAKDRSQELNEAIYKSLFCIKRNNDQ